MAFTEQGWKDIESFKCHLHAAEAAMAEGRNEDVYSSVRSASNCFGRLPQAMRSTAAVIFESFAKRIDLDIIIA